MSSVEVSPEQHILVTFGVYKPGPKHADPFRRDLVESRFMVGNTAKVESGASVWKMVLSGVEFGDCQPLIFWWMPWKLPLHLDQYLNYSLDPSSRDDRIVLR